ncbi:MAG: hypothetical protein JNN15_15745 [Blastocatellia bacterium]|nr:hypothetical protein [Blastocatellia bacterium]
MTLAGQKIIRAARVKPTRLTKIGFFFSYHSQLSQFQKSAISDGFLGGSGTGKSSELGSVVACVAGCSIGVLELISTTSASLNLAIHVSKNLRNSFEGK